MVSIKTATEQGDPLEGGDDEEEDVLRHVRVVREDKIFGRFYYGCDEMAFPFERLKEANK
jgi:hypothetical protein